MSDNFWAPWSAPGLAEWSATPATGVGPGFQKLAALKSSDLGTAPSHRPAYPYSCINPSKPYDSHQPQQQQNSSLDSLESQLTSAPSRLHLPKEGSASSPELQPKRDSRDNVSQVGKGSCLSREEPIALLPSRESTAAQAACAATATSGDLLGSLLDASQTLALTSQEHEPFSTVGLESLFSAVLENSPALSTTPPPGCLKEQEPPQATPVKKEAASKQPKMSSPATPAKTPDSQRSKRSRADGDAPPRKRGRKPQVPDGYDSQLKQLQESNVKLRHQLTMIQSASREAWRCLEHFQQKCVDSCRQNSALKEEVQQLRQKQVTESGWLQPRTQSRADAVLDSWGFGGGSSHSSFLSEPTRMSSQPGPSHQRLTGMSPQQAPVPGHYHPGSHLPPQPSRLATPSCPAPPPTWMSFTDNSNQQQFGPRL